MSRPGSIGTVVVLCLLATSLSAQTPEPVAVDGPQVAQTVEPPPGEQAVPGLTIAEPLSAETPAAEPEFPGIDIPRNGRVQSFVELLSGRLKWFLEEGLSRGARFLPMVQDIFRAEGLPLELAYVPLVESAFKTNALSRAKAKGMWQFMPGTASDHGLKRDWYVDERSDAEKATRAAATYLKTLAGMFNGDWHLALASYNAGPGRIQRAMRRSGRTDYWSLTANSRYLPRETREYVPQILAAIIIAKNPAEFGLSVQPLSRLPAEKVLVPGALDLRLVAEWAEVPFELLKELNPELKRWTTPVRVADYELSVPEGTGEVVRAKLAETGAESVAALDHYMVKKGETLQSVAKKLGVKRADLAEANYLSARAALRSGQRLIVPRQPVVLRALGPHDGATASSEDASSSGTLLAADVAADLQQHDDEAAASRSVHRVKRGDTLFSIARRYGTDVATLRQLNQLRGSAIKVGQRLTVGRSRINDTH